MSAENGISAGTCPVCASTDHACFVTRDNVPGTQNLLSATAQEARSVASARLQMYCCAECGFIWNAAFDGDRVRYDDAYENAQTHSDAFQTYVDGLVGHLLDECGVRSRHVMEVGCGNGSFLRRLVEAPGHANTGVGFDPAHRGPLEEMNGRLRFRREYLTGEPLDETFDVVVSRHVIEHVPEPVAFLQAIRGAVAQAPAARIFLETPCVEWILRQHTFWDLFHEHCSLFTEASLRTACQCAGLEVTDMRHVFGGQYLWLEATVADNPTTPTTCDADALPILARDFGAAERQWQADWQSELNERSGSERIAVWGAGAKGVTLLNLVDPRAERVRCVVDVNPQKQGGYLPGTGHPIVAPTSLAEHDIDTVLIMNPNYHEEITQLLDRLGINVTVVDPTVRLSAR